MADRIDHLTERVQVVEDKVDGLTTSVSDLTTSVGKLSTAVADLSTAMAAGFVEQREYTEFSHARLEAKMDTGFARFDRIERKLDQLIDADHRRPKPKRP